MDTVNSGDLVVRVSILYYTINYPTYMPFNATLGYVVGVIGVLGPRDILNVPKQGVMSQKTSQLACKVTFVKELMRFQILVSGCTAPQLKWTQLEALFI